MIFLINNNVFKLCCTESEIEQKCKKKWREVKSKKAKLSSNDNVHFVIHVCGCVSI